MTTLGLRGGPASEPLAAHSSSSPPFAAGFGTLKCEMGWSQYCFRKVCIEGKYFVILVKLFFSLIDFLSSRQHSLLENLLVSAQDIKDVKIRQELESYFTEKRFREKLLLLIRRAGTKAT